MIFKQAADRASFGADKTGAADVVHSLKNPGPDRLIVLIAMGPPPRV